MYLTAQPQPTPASLRSAPSSMGRIMLPIGEPVLVLDVTILLDAKTGSRVNAWVPPREKYFDYGDADQAMFLFEAWVAGPNPAAAKLYVQRTQSDGSDPEAFEPMNVTGMALAAGHTYTQRVFGRGATNTADRAPMGLGRVYLENESVASTDLVHLVLRGWVTAQRFGGLGRGPGGAGCKDCAR